MTVKHLQSMQRRQLSMAIQTDPTVIHKFKTGFVECADEVKRYISMLDGVDTGTRQRLSNYLNNCANSLEQIGSFTSFSNSFRSQTTQDCVNPPVIPTQIPFVAAHDTNNNNVAPLAINTNTSAKSFRHYANPAQSHGWRTEETSWWRRPSTSGKRSSCAAMCTR